MQIKNWTAILWDCLEEMAKIPDGIIDCVITDPPYWTTACKWDTVIPFDKMWEQLKRIIKPNGAIVLFGSEPFSSALRMSNIKMYRYDWVWNKKLAWNVFLAKSQPMKIHEIISVFNVNPDNYFPIKTDLWVIRKYKDKYWWGESFWKKWSWEKVYETIWKFPKSILEIPNTDRKWKVHPTQKPTALIEYLVKTYTNEWETVLDFTAGSFTTAVACENTNRKWICIEKEKEYFDIGINRIEQLKICE